MTKKQPPSKTAENESYGLLLLGSLLALSWLVSALAASSRIYFLSTYEVGKMVEPLWEPFAATNAVVAVCLGLAASWLMFLWLNHKADCRSQTRPMLWITISLLPLAFWGLRVAGVATWPAHFWEVIWIAGWTGLSFGELARQRIVHRQQPIAPNLRFDWLAGPLSILLTTLAGVWWFSQSVAYHQNFLLGFNDFGHFLQRVANTAEGRGVLLETPVLPMFWDHFNPGLLLLVPLWKIYPSVKLVFALQAASLAVGGLLLFHIAKRMGHSNWVALTFGLAWIVQPSVGQMNLAYTYGWHPITFAIPLLLAAILCLLSKRKLAALIFTVMALSMEEGVFVMVALVAAVCAALPYIEKWYIKTNVQGIADNSSSLAGALATTTWLVVALTSVLGFVLVYKLSGLAEFQTGRFVALGNSPIEIALSPLMRPTAFWGQVLQIENVFFVLLLWLPCGLPSLLQGWRYLLPTLLPLGVLIVWDHAPAHNLAFQYPSTLLPFFWLASVSGAAKEVGSRKSIDALRPANQAGLPNATTAMVTGLVLSLFVGEFPFSSPTLLDIEAMTYGADTELRRKIDGVDGRWLTEQVEKIRATGDECLATTRIAAHLVGNRDIETVGQYLQRREKLSELADRKGAPIRHYRWVVLDRNDHGNWSGQETAKVEEEARQSRFELVEEQYNIVVYRRIDSAENE